MEIIQKPFRKLAFDIDGVLVDFMTPFLKFHNKRHGTNFVIGDLSTYHFYQPLKVSDEYLQQEMMDFYNSSLFLQIKPLPGSIEAIEKLGRRNLLYSVTSRPDTIRDPTINLLRSHFPGSFLQVHFTSQYGGNGFSKKKSDICLQNGYEMIIEDVPGYANECAERGIPGFLLTRPWNILNELHPDVKRVNGWGEILEHLQ